MRYLFILLCVIGCSTEVGPGHDATLYCPSMPATTIPKVHFWQYYRDYLYISHDSSWTTVSTSCNVRWAS